MSVLRQAVFGTVCSVRVVHVCKTLYLYKTHVCLTTHAQ